MDLLEEKVRHLERSLRQSVGHAREDVAFDTAMSDANLVQEYESNGNQAQPGLTLPESIPASRPRSGGPSLEMDHDSVKIIRYGKASA